MCLLRIANLKISLDAGAEAPLEAALKKLNADRKAVLSWRV